MTTQPASQPFSTTQRIAFRLYLFLCFTDVQIVRSLRRTLLRIVLKSPLGNLQVDRSVKFTGLASLNIGENVSIHHWSYISADGGLDIGDNVAIGHRCSILTADHEFKNTGVPIKSQPVSYKPVSLADNIWLGANVTILAGVELGPNMVVAAGAVVTKSFPDGNAVIGGVPAKQISEI